MPTFLLAAGKNIYFAPDTGPAIGWIYGPVMPALMTPVTLLPSLTSAMLGAACLNAALLLAPLLWAVDGVAKRVGQSGRERAWLLAACAGGSLAVPWIANALVYITADNAVVALTLISCICLANAEDNGRGFWTSAVFAALAVWTKQLAIGIPVAQLLWLLWKGGGSAAARHAVRLLAAGLVVAAICVAIFGWSELRYNLWTVPSHHPLKVGSGSWLPQLGRELLACLPGLLALVVLRARKAMPVGAAALVAFVALVQLPLGALGASKVGGGENSFHAAYYFNAAAWLELAGSAGVVARWLRQRLALVAAIAVVLGLFITGRNAGWRLTPAVQLEASCALAESRHGQIYFPRNPLITWWTERKVYHLEYGYFDQAMAGHPATTERLFAYLPPQLHYIVYQDDISDHAFARLLPGFVHSVHSPGFFVYVKGVSP